MGGEMMVPLALLLSGGTPLEKDPLRQKRRCRNSGMLVDTLLCPNALGSKSLDLKCFVVANSTSLL